MRPIALSLLCTASLATLILGLAGTALGCAGHAQPAAAAPGPAVAASGGGTLNVALASDGLAPAFSQLNLQLSGLALEVAGTWRQVPLDALNPTVDGNGTPVPAPVNAQSVNLIGLGSGSPATLASKVAWPAGLTTGVRLQLASGSTVTLAADGSVHTLVTPAQLDSGMGLPGGFTVAQGGTTNLMILVGLANCALPDPVTTGAYDFQPLAMRGYDQAATGTLTGSLAPVPDATGAVLAPPGGAVVTAQLDEPLSAPGAGVLFRTAVTDASGHFSFDLLPLGYTWSVVSQPAGFLAEASIGVALGDAPFNTGTPSLPLTAAAATGTLSGALAQASPAGEVDVVDLVQTFAGEAVTVQSAAVAAGSFSFTAVPPGTYQAVLNRYSYSAGLGISDQRTVTAPFAIATLATTHISF
jgi:hypothetical protein